MTYSCNKKDIHYRWYGKRPQMVEVSCRKCGLKEPLPSLTYFKMWGYPEPTEKLPPFEWLHDKERRAEKEMNEKVKVSFIDTVNNVTLGNSMIPFGAITKLNIGDRLEFKDVGAIFGIYEIQSFAVNHGHPEGHINLTPVKAKAKIKLHQVNEKFVDELLPF